MRAWDKFYHPNDFAWGEGQAKFVTKWMDRIAAAEIANEILRETEAAKIIKQLTDKLRLVEDEYHSLSKARDSAERLLLLCAPCVSDDRGLEIGSWINRFGRNQGRT